MLVVDAQRQQSPPCSTADYKYNPLRAQAMVSEARLYSGHALMANGTAVTVAEGATTQPLATGLSSGTSFSVTVGTQASGETCTVAGGSGARSNRRTSPMWS